MSIEITASPDTLMRQASMSAHDYMRAAKTETDKVFGDGYAAKNPALVGAFIQTCAADYGAAISAKRSIQIGEGTRTGPFCLILDNDFHTVGDRDAPGVAAPIEIGCNVTLGARVTVLRGTRIGDGARVVSGSTVAGVIPNGALVSGVPARVGGNDSVRNVARSVATLIMQVFKLTTLPTPTDELAQITGWTDVGVIRLQLALEEALGITLPAEELHVARTIEDVTGIVARARS